jgi:hypothetical protein
MKILTILGARSQFIKAMVNRYIGNLLLEKEKTNTPITNTQIHK